MLTISNVLRYIHEYDIKNEFLFCTSLKTTTKSEGVMEKISTFFDTEGLQYSGINYVEFAQMVHQLCLVQDRDSRLK